MSKKERSRKENPGFVTKEMCGTLMRQANEERDLIKNALFGEDMRGGMAKDISDIKADLKTAKMISDLVRPVLIAVVSSFLTYGLIHLLGI